VLDRDNGTEDDDLDDPDLFAKLAFDRRLLESLAAGFLESGLTASQRKFVCAKMGRASICGETEPEFTIAGFRPPEDLSSSPGA
jgi:hypothetical protein